MSTAIDLSTIPAPDIIEELSFETIRNEMLADLQARDPLFNAIVASDPIYKEIETHAYRELLVRQRINDAIKGNLLSEATGTDLHALVSYYNVTPLVITPEDLTAIPPIAAVYESDDDLRQRALLAYESFSVAGSVGAYQFHAKSADGKVKDVYVKTPSPGSLTISILSTVGDGTADAALVSIVDAALSSDDVRPLTDNVTVQSASIINYSVTAQIFVYSGPSLATVLAAAQVSAQAYIDSMEKIGRDITLTGLTASMHVSGVQRVEMSLPAADIAITDEQAAYCTALTITVGGVAE